ncbi:CDP-alcohol phosphatidyltransferase family protein, partial [Candidatus Woesearchaeota archaeon]|nr:CDP-alcohol phosphatidyltransferase family protein [Candidatus Woesearchaeota archaeon]
KGKSLLWNAETKLKNWLVPCVPKSVETYHLTMTTVLWSIGVIIFCFLATYDIIWLWGSSAMIFFQYITDLLDGEIGRRRNTGLIKWGYYMDHFLDYIFLCSLIIGYAILMPDQYLLTQLFILMLFGAFMVNSYLGFATTNEFKISYMKIGPTEVRIGFIAVNTMIIFFGKTYTAPAIPFIMIFALLGLIFTVYRSQKHIWELDMANKGKQKKR